MNSSSLEVTRSFKRDTVRRALAFCELWTMKAETPGQFNTAVRWLHGPVWVIVVFLNGLVRLYFRAGLSYLAWTICALRTFSLLLDFLVGQNLNNLKEVRWLRVRFPGESVSVAEKLCDGG